MGTVLRTKSGDEFPAELYWILEDERLSVDERFEAVVVWYVNHVDKHYGFSESQCESIIRDWFGCTFPNRKTYKKWLKKRIAPGGAGPVRSVNGRDIFCHAYIARSA